MAEVRRMQIILTILLLIPGILFAFEIYARQAGILVIHTGEVQVQIPEWLEAFLILIFGEWTVLLGVSIFNYLRGKRESEERKQLMESMNKVALSVESLVDEIRAEREDRKKSAS